MKKRAVMALLGAAFAAIAFTGCKAEEIPAPPHVHGYGDWITVREADCEKAGERKRSCECGDMQTETIPAAGHKSDEYLKDGERHWKVCEVCEKEFSGGEHLFTDGECSVCEQREVKPAICAFTLNETEDGYIVTGIAEGDLLTEIPATHLGLPVTEIGAHAFEGKSLTQIALPDSVTVIGDYAFCGCTALKSVTFGKELQTIGEYAFKETAIKELDLPDTLTLVKDEAFSFTKQLKYVEIPKSAKLVGFVFWKSGLQKAKITGSTTGWGRNGISGYVFYECDSLTEGVLGEEASAQAYFAFGECKNLLDYTVENNPNYFAENGVVYNADGTKAIKCAKGRESASVKEGVTEIGLCAFQSCGKLKSVTLPQSLTRIGELAFNAAGIEEIVIPDNVSRMDRSPFANCSDLKKVSFGTGSISFYNNPFTGCTALTEITVSEQNEMLTAVNGCLMTKKKFGVLVRGPWLIRANLAGEIPAGVETINKDAFADCKEAEELFIPASVKEIEMDTFAKLTNLKKVTFENTSGWTVTKNGASYPSQAVAVNVTDVGKNAELVNSTYSNYVWRRSDT